MGGHGGQLPSHVLADQLTLSQPEEADYSHHISTCHPRFSDLPPSLEKELEAEASEEEQNLNSPLNIWFQI